MDEPTKPAEQSSGAETTTQDTPTGTKETTEPVETQEQAETPDPGESTQETTTQQEPKKETRAEKRLRQLLHKDGEGDDAGEPDGSQSTTPSQQDLPTPPWYQPKVEPGQEVTPDQYKADVARTAQEIAGLEIKKFQQQQQELKKQEKQVKAFDSAVTELEKQFPALNPDAKEFNESLSNRVSKLYQKAAGKQPNADLLREIIATVMDASEQAKVEGQSSVTKALVDQEAQEAISPTGGNHKTDYSQADLEQLKKTNPAKVAEILGKKLSWVE